MLELGSSRLDGLKVEAPCDASEAGLILAWIDALPRARRERLLGELIRSDLALKQRAGGLYARDEPEARLAMLLLAECAGAGGLSAAELAVLLRDAPAALLAGLDELVRRHAAA